MRTTRELCCSITSKALRNVRARPRELTRVDCLFSPRLQGAQTKFVPAHAATTETGRRAGSSCSSVRAWGFRGEWAEKERSTGCVPAGASERAADKAHGEERKNVHRRCTSLEHESGGATSEKPRNSREKRNRATGEVGRTKARERDTHRNHRSAHRCRCARSRNTDGGESALRGAARSCTRTADDFRTTERASERANERGEERERERKTTGRGGAPITTAYGALDTG